MTWTVHADPPGGVDYGYSVLTAVGTKLYMVQSYVDNAPIYIYDTLTDSWSTGPTTQNFENVGAVIIAGIIYFIDEIDHIWSYVPDAGVANDLGQASSGAGYPNYNRGVGAVVVIGSRVYRWAGNRFITYDIADLTVVTQLSLSPGGYTQYRDVVTDGAKIYAVEGYGDNWGVLGLQPLAQSDTGVLETYDPATDSWSYSMNTDPNFRVDLKAIYYGGVIYAIGGGTDDFYPPYSIPWVSAYNVGADTWEVLEELPHARADPGAVVCNGRLYVFGGYYDDASVQPLLISMPVAVAAPTFTLPFYDPFTRDNAAELGAPWITVAATTALGVIDGMAAPAAAGEAISVVDFHEPDVTMSVVLTAAPAGVVFRMTLDSCYWRVRGDALEYVDSTVLATFALGPTLTAGDVIRVFLHRSLISIYVNGTRRLKIHDERNMTATKHGIRSDDATARMDEYRLARSVAVPRSGITSNVHFVTPR